MTKELTDRSRPQKLADLRGQTEAVTILQAMSESGKIPHALLFSGPSGCGKTTCARIVSRLVKAKGLDYQELNAASSRGIDTVREIQTKLGYSPLHGKAKLWVIDEAHQLTKDAQSALLKITEDIPDHVYFILCTTDPAKLLGTLKNRFTEIKVRSISALDMSSYLTALAKKEGINADKEAIDRIVAIADGSMRKAVSTLDKIRTLKKKSEMLDAIQSSESRQDVFELVKALMPFKGGCNWNDVKTCIERMGDEEPEGVRRLVIAICGTHMLKGGPMAKRARIVFDSFQYNLFDTGKSGLIAACYDVVFGK